MTENQNCVKCDTPLQDSFLCCPQCGADLARTRRRMECCGERVVTGPDTWVRVCPYCKKPTGLLHPRDMEKQRRLLQVEEAIKAREKQKAMNYQKPLFGVTVRTVKLNSTGRDRQQRIIRLLLKEAEHRNARIVAVSDSVQAIQDLHKVFETSVHRNWTMQAQLIVDSMNREKALSVDDKFQRGQFLLCVSRHLGDLRLKNVNRIVVLSPLGVEAVGLFSRLIGSRANVRDPQIIELQEAPKERLAAYVKGGATIQEA